MLSPYIHVCIYNLQYPVPNASKPIRQPTISHIPKMCYDSASEICTSILVAQGWLASNNYGAAACKVRDLPQAGPVDIREVDIWYILQL